MEFIVDEAGCRQLSADMLHNLKQIARIIAEIDSQSSLLHAALGEDVDAIARSVRVMGSELENADRELGTIITDMQEYMAQVQQAKVALH